ncbi:MAG TPA: class I SAM-dependent methyltransferase [Mycobacteriales bacterium]|nr:class I SAM-dependent methyltransferase [Mycobacteriales bacterium]
MTRTQVAPALATVLEAPLRIRAYDGSVAGPADAPVEIELRSRKALAHIVSAPGELGLARAYVSGEMDVRTGDRTPPDHYAVLRHLAGAKIGALSWHDRLEVVRSLGREALTWVEPPPQEVGAKRYVAGLRAHLPGRDALAIAHHYDVSNTFYRWVLGPSMAYTCAVYPRDDASLEQAQENKFDLVCRKLGLRPGMRLLDVGCGWGGMVRHAVRHYGVTALGVTLSRRQAEYGQKVLAEDGLADRAEIRHADYRSVVETGFDAVSSIGLTEHIGIAQLPAYAARLAARLKPQGRLLNHCITRPDEESSPIARRGFIARYVFPDGELPGVGKVIGVLQRAGLEVRHEENLREHYARTLTAWCDNLDAHWDDAVREVGPGTAKVWALYMAGSRLEFERNRIQLHQVLAVKPDRAPDGSVVNGMPLRPDWGV